MEEPLFQNCQPGETCYFQYTIKKSDDLDDLLILINLSQKSKLQAFLHWTQYPSVKRGEHDYALGAVEPKQVADLFHDKWKMELFLDESPFVYDTA